MFMLICDFLSRYNRDWQYHQDLKLWFKRGSTTDGLSTTTNQYIYFDINSWECRLFSSPHVGKNIASGLLREDDVRVKFATSSRLSSEIINHRYAVTCTPGFPQYHTATR